MTIERDRARKNLFVVKDADETILKALNTIRENTKYNIEYASLIDIKINLITFMVANHLPETILTEELDVAMAAPIIKLEKEYLNSLGANLHADIYFTLSVHDVENKIISYALM